MGKNTYLSIGRELKKRKNIIISKTLKDNKQYEQYSNSLSTSSQNNPNTFSVFRTKNSRYSAIKSHSKAKEHELEKSGERKTNFQLHLPSSSSSSSNSVMNTPRKGRDRGGKTNEYSSRVSQYLTVSPSSLSCRLALSSSSY